MLTFFLNCQTFVDNTQKRRNFRNISRFKTQSKSQNMQKKERTKKRRQKQADRKNKRNTNKRGGGGHNKLS